MAEMWHGVKIKERKWFGYRRDSRDARDHLFDAQSSLVGALVNPAAVDLRKNCPPVMDQGAIGSCTAHGITGALRFALMAGGHGDHALARLQLYYDERVIEGNVNDDAGAEIRDGIKCAAKIGVAHEVLWPYKVNRFTKRPTAAVYRDALRFEALEYKRVEVSTAAVKSALAQGFPVIIGLDLYESFDTQLVADTGIVRMPQPNEEIIGGHCMYVVGYGQKPSMFTVRNSWNTDWGDKGDCYFPEEFIGSPKYGGDYWLISKLVPTAM